VGVFGRIRRALAGTAGSVAARPADDPASGADAVYARQLAALEAVRRSVADLMTVRRQLEARANQLGESKAQLEARAASAAADGRDADARAALADALHVERRLPDMVSLLADLRTREGSLQAAAETLGRRVQASRARIELLKVRAAAASAEAHAQAALAADPGEARTATRDPGELPARDDGAAGVADELADATRLLERARFLATD
jgi:phage shock protein A